ncbi:WD repeat-containing protein 4 [Entomophthora muscae]|uniref:WD repeat-containing protein 4 n=1 Tax=Entomophthora muscae TaxID=34485 RepID=A0ACC2TS84_9FUNG|nr:WD repeat-containing protein 4 [Entomophthora muscae]
MATEEEKITPIVTPQATDNKEIEAAHEKRNTPVTGIKFQQKRSPADSQKSYLAVIILVSVLKIFDVRGGKLVKDIFLNVSEENPEKEISSEFLVLDACFSEDGTKFAVILDNKILRIFNTADWTVIFERALVKRATAIAFTHNGADICIADKFGDAYRFPILGGELETEPIVGHVSVLTDLALSPDDKYFLTADRDEKVRVSCYPNGYNIHTFCLGHREFVSSLCLPFVDEAVLISGGGDSYLVVSNYLSGKHLQKVDLLSPLQLEQSTPRITVSSITSACASNEANLWVAVLVENIPKVLLFKAHATKLEFHQSLELKASPYCLGFESSGSLYIADNVGTDASIVHFTFDEEKGTFEQDSSRDSLVNLVASSQTPAPKNLKISPRGDLRKLRPGAPGSHRLGPNVDEGSGDEELELSKKAKVE